VITIGFISLLLKFFENIQKLDMVFLKLAPVIVLLILYWLYSVIYLFEIGFIRNITTYLKLALFSNLTTYLKCILYWIINNVKKIM